MKEALIRIHARICGDGCIGIYETSEEDRNRRGRVAYTNKDEKNLEEFKKDMREIFDVKTTRTGNEIQVKSIRIVNQLKELGDFGSRDWRIPSSIQDLSEGKKLEWLRAFIRDEGHYEPRYNRLRIKSMNKEGLEDVKRLLNSLNIAANITGPNCDDSFYLNISNISEKGKITEIAKNKPKARE